MRESWRWFGPNDPVSLAEIRQTGATDIVSALHDISIGERWPREAIAAHKAMIEEHNDTMAPLHWTVVESIPVHDDIKLAAPGNQKYIDNWIATLENLAAEDITTICYNFMPVIDWTRTDLKYQLANGAYALRFDQDRFAAFDLFILRRANAADDYSQDEYGRAQRVYEAMTAEEMAGLTSTIIAGLPGKMTDAYTLEDFREALAKYAHLDHDGLRKNLVAFLAQVLPHAEKAGVKLAIHPDDPPWDMFGLPRVICTPDDLDKLFGALPSPANGITLCVGTYGSRPDNDLPQMAHDYAQRIHFAHLRGVTRDPDEQRSFYEASHLDSDIDMVRVIRHLLENERALSREIFIRPDHGHLMMGDINRTSNPGYSAIGRMKGLAEIRGVIKALSAAFPAA
ncbi:mannonate dehydratase [Parasphingorhabdus halotolerans]|uniref:Mannonate dehydratase n=1 Tax=Parasphingorhabdus halotolerans TaxID=2725558 RepID=A0A6H2DQD6_9SPHN|nr:mannonate dehydratase [Parasphingorhabdus halotolerans]QJB70193.1 mannonate dehydratase [Parasphingorhabdus halotolerans]